MLSAIVPCRDRAGLLDGCLLALRASLADTDELIVVDSASAGAEVAQVALRHGAHLVRAGWPGASRARNLGGASARGDLLAFVDDDVRVDQGWADAVRACFAQHPDVEFVTGRIAVPQHQRHLHRPVAVMDDDAPRSFDAAAQPVEGHGANLAVRRAAFDAVGGFDEAFGPGARFRAAEDHDLFDRLLAAGFRGRYEPAASAVHDQWRQRWSLVALEWAYGVGSGARLARLRRRVPGLASRVATTTLWHEGVRSVPGSLRGGHEFQVAFVAARVAGTVTGFVSATLRGHR